MQTTTMGNVEARPVRPVQELVREHGGQRATARAAGLAEPHVSLIVNGKRSPTYATRQKLARVFGVRVDEMEFPADRKTTGL
jgi:transcriptional regulator with XRE-family HTH domain